MTYPEFQTWALGQGQVPKFDGTVLGECVSLINQYCYRVLNVPAGAWGDAYQWGQPGNANVQKYFQIVSDKQVGDIIVYPAGWAGSGPGHIGIYAGNNQILEQNGHVSRRVSLSPLAPGYYAILRIRGIGVKMTDQGDIVNVAHRLWGQDPSQADINKWVNKSFKDWYYAADSDQRTANHIAELQAGVTPYSGPQLYLKQ